MYELQIISVIILKIFPDINFVKISTRQINKSENSLKSVLVIYSNIKVYIYKPVGVIFWQLSPSMQWPHTSGALEYSEYGGVAALAGHGTNIKYLTLHA